MNNNSFKILELLKEKPEQYFNTSVDIIALSCTRQRLGDKTYYEWTDNWLENNMTNEDRQKALSIQKHYGELIICEQLKGRDLT